MMSARSLLCRGARRLYLLFFLPFLIIGQAFSAQQCYEYFVNWNGRQSGWGPLPQVCAGLSFSESNSSFSKNVTVTVAADGKSCQFTQTVTYPNNPGANSTGSGPIPVNSRLIACPTDPQPDNCAENDGKVSTANFTIGWARTSNTDSRDFVGALNFPNTDRAACVNGCRASFDQTASADVWRSQVPSTQGLYRISGDYTMIGGNLSCTPGPEDAPFNPLTPNMQCPGYVGEVNGTTVCVGNANKPIPPPEGQSPKDKTGKSEGKGNPSAGKKPTTGEGSGSDGAGRTPSTGNGGNPGGPAAAAGGGSGNGSGSEDGEGDKDKKGCGLPGQPKCQIDESGTPDGKTAYGELNGKLDGLDAQRKTGTEKIMGTGDKDTGWGTSWSWFANGQCRPISLGNLPIGTGVEMRIDICHIVPYTNLVLNFLWAVGTFIAVLGMVFRVTTRGD